MLLVQTFGADLRWPGAMFNEPPSEGKLPIRGSVMLAWASSKEEVMEHVKSDIYATSEVWDLSKVEVYPFKSAIRQPL